jgi:hypothetical protein
VAVLTATAAKGLGVQQGTTPLYTTHDNASDNFVAGVYSHNPLEASATEFDLVASFLLYLQTYYGQFYRNIVAGQTFTINAGASAVVAGPLLIDGTLIVNDRLVVL